MATRHCKVLIIGSGPAGYTAAIYAARANLAPVMIQGLEVGGQLSITTDVENYPGFPEVIQGPWLMEQMAGQAANCGAELVFDLVTAVDLSRRPFACTTDGGDRYLADALILATGATVRAACGVARVQGAARVVLAAPVCSPDTAHALHAEVDELVCLEIPRSFHAVGRYYADFRPVSDDEVAAVLHAEG